MSEQKSISDALQPEPEISVAVFERQEEHLECHGFPQPTNRDASVWRYLDLWKFVYMLQRKELPLSRIDTFDDRFEGSLPQPTVERLNNQSREDRKVRAQLIQNRPTYSYASCWSLSPTESMALWRLFCGNTNGIAIKTTYKKLLKSTYGCCEDRLSDGRSSVPYTGIGIVKYIDYSQNGYDIPGSDIPGSDIPGSERTITTYIPFLHKHHTFAYEKEVRVIWINYQEEEHKEELPAIMPLRWDITNVIESIYIHPAAPEGHLEIISALIQKFTPGWNPRIQWSQLKRPPQY